MKAFGGADKDDYVSLLQTAKDVLLCMTVAPSTVPLRS